MRLAQIALLAVVAAAAVGCAGSQRRPQVTGKTGPPLVPLSQVRVEIRAARASNSRVFSIFPTLPGTKRCAIPAIAGLRELMLRGTCRTSVAHPATHGRYREAFVSFREEWGRRHTTWTVIVQQPAEKVVTTQVTGAPAPQYRYGTDRVARNIELTRHVPCPGTRPRVGPARLRRLHAVTAVRCEEDLRIPPGRGKWKVFIRRVAVGDVAGLQSYFEQPSQPTVPSNGICLAYLAVVAPIAFVDGHGQWVVPRTPVDRCLHPLGFPSRTAERQARWRVVSRHRVKVS
jgi:hypothetical protein